jgi:hypothetical protein
METNKQKPYGIIKSTDLFRQNRGYTIISILIWLHAAVLGCWRYVLTQHISWYCFENRRTTECLLLRKTIWDVTFTDVSKDSNASFMVRHVDYLAPRMKAVKSFETSLTTSRRTAVTAWVRYRRSAVPGLRIFVLVPPKSPCVWEGVNRGGSRSPLRRLDSWYSGSWFWLLAVRNLSHENVGIRFWSGYSQTSVWCPVICWLG